ncbi:MAG: hypothetical protein GDA40_09860 [Rhodobacteraceae bacterium]|nr:hypothetical protein [Paracoccaceae bacterium]
MEILRVVLAAAAAYAFGAVWYMLWAKPWVAAAGVESLSLVSEAEDGMFHQLCRAPLGGAARCLDAGA